MSSNLTPAADFSGEGKPPAPRSWSRFVRAAGNRARRRAGRTFQRSPPVVFTGVPNAASSCERRPAGRRAPGGLGRIRRRRASAAATHSASYCSFGPVGHGPDSPATAPAGHGPDSPATAPSAHGSADPGACAAAACSPSDLASLAAERRRRLLGDGRRRRLLGDGRRRRFFGDGLASVHFQLPQSGLGHRRAAWKRRLEAGEGLQTALLPRLDCADRAEAAEAGIARVRAGQARARRVRGLPGRAHLPASRTLPRCRTVGGEPGDLPPAHPEPRAGAWHLQAEGTDDPRGTHRRRHAPRRCGAREQGSDRPGP